MKKNAKLNIILISSVLLDSETLQKYEGVINLIWSVFLGFWTDHVNEWGVALPMSEAYSDPYKVTKVERLAKLVNGY